MPHKKPLVGPPKSLSNESQAAARATEKRLADLRSGRAAAKAGTAPKPKTEKAPSKTILGAAKLLKDAAKR